MNQNWKPAQSNFDKDRTVRSMHASLIITYPANESLEIDGAARNFLLHQYSDLFAPNHHILKHRCLHNQKAKKIKAYFQQQANKFWTYFKNTKFDRIKYPQCNKTAKNMIF